MGSPKEIKDNAKDLWDSVLKFVKGKGGIYTAILGTFTYLGLELKDVSDYAHSIANLPHTERRIDTLEMEVSVIHTMLNSDPEEESEEFNRVYKKIRSFMDTVPALYMKANFMEKAFNNVERKQEKLEDRVDKVDDKVDDVKGQVRSISSKIRDPKHYTF